MLRHYSHVKKPFKGGTWHAPFFPVRVVGLCLEQAYKVSCEKGLNCLTASDLGTLELPSNASTHFVFFTLTKALK